MDSVVKYLVEFGFNKKDAEKIVKTYPLYNSKEETLLNKCRDNNKYFLKLGYTKEEIMKMLKVLPALYSYSIENIKQKIDDMVSLGYTREEVLKMTKVLPALYSYSIENIKQKIKDMVNLGYTEKEVIKMTKLLPALYSYSIENIRQKIEDIIRLGYAREEVLKMTKVLPSLYSYSIENIKQKIEYLNEIGLEVIVLKDTKNLMQSVALTYARYEFLKEKGYSITEENYQKLFYRNKTFTKQFAITKQELLERYPYKNRKEDNKKLAIVL